MAAIQRRDLANGATGLDEIRCNPIKMHKVVRFCRNKKRHEARAGNGQYIFFFFFAGKLWGYNGSHAALSGVLFEDDELYSHRNAGCTASKSLLCS